MTGPAERSAFHLVGVVRGERRRIPLRSDEERSGELQTARFRDLAALLRSGPPSANAPDPDDVLRHHRAVEQAMQRGDVAPAPWGIVFAERDDAADLLRGEYVALDHALALVEGRWEFRVHMVAGLEGDLGAWAKHRTEAFNELRRLARAAVSSAPASGGRSLVSSFLVERTASDAFAERVQELTELHPELALEITGPWPPYDFIHFGLR